MGGGQRAFPSGASPCISLVMQLYLTHPGKYMNTSLKTLLNGAKGAIGAAVSKSTFFFCQTWGKIERKHFHFSLLKSYKCIPLSWCSCVTLLKTQNLTFLATTMMRMINTINRTPATIMTGIRKDSIPG